MTATAVHVPPTFGVAAIRTFAGRVSTKAAVSEIDDALAFSRVMVRRVMPPGLMVPKPNDLVTDGGVGARTTKPAVTG